MDVPVEFYKMLMENLMKNKTRKTYDKYEVPQKQTIAEPHTILIDSTRDHKMAHSSLCEP